MEDTRTPPGERDSAPFPRTQSIGTEDTLSDHSRTTRKLVWRQGERASRSTPRLGRGVSPICGGGGGGGSKVSGATPRVGGATPRTGGVSRATPRGGGVSRPTPRSQMPRYDC